MEYDKSLENNLSFKMFSLLRLVFCGVTFSLVLISLFAITSRLLGHFQYSLRKTILVKSEHNKTLEYFIQIQLNSFVI